MRTTSSKYFAATGGTGRRTSSVPWLSQARELPSRYPTTEKSLVVASRRDGDAVTRTRIAAERPTARNQRSKAITESEDVLRSFRREHRSSPRHRAPQADRFWGAATARRGVHG